MPQYLDSYYLVEDRNSKLVYDFFKKYSFLRRELADEYPFPQFSDFPQRFFSSVEELLSYLDKNPQDDYIVYWRNENERSEIKQFTLQYTDDGKMIFGISIYGNKPSSLRSIELYKEVKSYLNSSISCITVEEPPPSNSVEFVEFCSGRYR